MKSTPNAAFALTLLSIIIFNVFVHAQDGVRIAASAGTADPSAMLDVTSTGKGVLIPRMTASQRTAISLPATGLLVFQTDGTPGFYYNAGTPGAPNWVILSAGALSGAGTTNYVTKWTASNALGAGTIYDNGNVGIGMTSPVAKLQVSGGIMRTNSRVTDSQRYPVGRDGYGGLFPIDPTWTNAELQAYFNTSAVQWVNDPTAPAGWAIQITGAVNVGGTYNSGFPYIPIDDQSTYYMECWIKNVSGSNTHYMGSIDYDANFGNPTGNPGSFGYWVMSNTNPGSSWTKVSGYIKGFGSSVGTFVAGSKYWTPQALFNYTGGGSCMISGWKVTKLTTEENLPKPIIWSGGCTSHGSAGGWNTYCTNAVEFNTAAGYFSTDGSGVFTVQKAGYIRINAWAISLGNGYGHVIFYHNGIYRQYGHEYVHGAWSDNVMDLVWPMNVGDTFYIAYYNSGNYAYHSWNSQGAHSRLQVEYKGRL